MESRRSGNDNDRGSPLTDSSLASFIFSSLRLWAFFCYSCFDPVRLAPVFFLKVPPDLLYLPSSAFL